MFKHPYILIFLCAFVFIAGCGLLDGDKEVPFKNPVYANVFFERAHKNGAPVHGIVAINYDNPKEFKLLASGKSAYNNLRLSPDGEKLIYTDDYETGLGSVPQHGLFNTRTGKKELLFQIFEGDKLELVGHESIDVVWNTDSEGFYFTNPAQSFGAIQSVYYYNLKTRKVELIKGVPPFAIYPIDLISEDTLMVYSTDSDTLAYYRMSTNGNHMDFLQNSKLDIIIENGLGKKGFLDEEYNISNHLITASYLNKEKFNGYKIIVTNLSGTIFKEYANGDYLNRNPTWTKDGNIIFTEQRNLYDNQIQSELKKIDLKTGEITPFFSKREYPKITGIGTSDQ